jgi:hypothetical protein
MWDERSLERVIIGLASNSTDGKAEILENLQMSFLTDPRLISATEALLDDDSPCFVLGTEKVSEIRWLAARVLARQRLAADSKGPVVLCRTIRPIPVHELLEVASRVSLEEPKWKSHIPKLLNILRTLGLVSFVDSAFTGTWPIDAQTISCDEN